jgi:hypothetical protein
MEKIQKQNWFGFDVEKDREIQRIIEAYIRDYEGNSCHSKRSNVDENQQKEFSK